MAALETRDHVAESGGEKTGVVQVVIKHEKTEFIVCSLFYGTVFQQPLDLNFTEGEELTFFTEGRGIVHLTGYLVKEEPVDVDQDDLMSLEDASSSDEATVSSEGMASGEESARQEITNRPRKRKKKRTRWKVRDPERRRRTHYQRKRRKFEGAERINPQRLPRKSSGSVKPSGDRENVHTRGWTTTVVGNVVSRTSNADTMADEENLEKVCDTVVSTCVSSIPSKNNDNVKETSDRASLLGKSLDTSEGDQSSRASADVKSFGKQGEIGVVLRETVARQSPTVSNATVRTSGSPVQQVSGGSALPSPSVQTPESVNSPAQSAKDGQISKSSSSQNVPVHRPSISVTKQPTNSNQERTKEREVSPQRHSSAGRLRPPSEGTSSQDKPGVVVKDEDDDEVLIEEIKIEDDSSEGEQHSFSMATHLPQTIPSSSVATTQQGLPRITSVTSIRNQPLIGSQLVGVPQFQEPAAWNIPGTSRGPPGVSLQQRANMVDPFMTPQERLAQQPMPVALTRQGDPIAVGEMGDFEGSNEEGEMILSEEVLRTMPVATEMRDLTPNDLEVNGVDISQEQILLARGYNVFLTRGQLYDVQMASRETSKTPWSVCVRRLMDIYFDRQTLAMGKATSHGFSNNPERKALNQEVIQAIKEYVATRYNKQETHIHRSMSVYCSDTRRTAEGRRKKDGPSYEWYH